MNEKVNARIQALEAELAGLKKDLAEQKKEGRWRAEFNGNYKTITSNKGKMVDDVFTDTKAEFNDMCYNNSNYFRPDTDEADRIAEKINLLLAMTARVKELNGDWVADWSGINNKYRFGIILHLSKCQIDFLCENNRFVFGLSVQSKEHAEILLEEFKERIERWY